MTLDFSTFHWKIVMFTSSVNLAKCYNLMVNSYSAKRDEVKSICTTRSEILQVQKWQRMTLTLHTWATKSKVTIEGQHWLIGHKASCCRPKYIRMKLFQIESETFAMLSASRAGFLGQRYCINVIFLQFWTYAYYLDLLMN